MESTTIRKDLTNDFEKNYDAFIALLQSLTNEQLNTVPSFGGWTLGQVAMHVIKATGGIPDKHTKDAGRAFDQHVKQLQDIFLDFNTKMKSPGAILPGDGPFGKENLLGEIRGLKKMHLHDIAIKDPYALCMGMEMPGVGYMTRYEWWKFILAHLQRHTHQLNNIIFSFG